MQLIVFCGILFWAYAKDRDLICFCVFSIGNVFNEENVYTCKYAVCRDGPKLKDKTELDEILKNISKIFITVLQSFTLHYTHFFVYCLS